jgi:SNF2 family DNA or RNA helicase
VLVYYPIFDNTIEGIIYDILNNKKRIIATVMGDTQDETNVVEEILRSIAERR